ncbi:tetratricopeptide repeat protein [Microscilla marina]|uniref:Tetratricopeptide repeat domain protein n=1 Tax=Microscilla marina ATCC 23134 TaxID=313606 RepID=A1ZU22_MICM2|nr:tetratricopeptide repeat protein [Microscilla marina]EAY26135.1 tetratricopeptide repeat domain protein [Microscilla marina ATCC 23134]
MKKIIFILTIITLSIAQLSAQDKAKIDSLLQKLPTVKDSTEVDVLNGLAHEYLLFKDKEKDKQAEDYITRLLSISRKLSYAEGLAVGLRNLSVINMRHGEYRKALRDLFQALAMVEDTGKEVDQAVCFRLIGDCYEQKENFGQAIDYYIKSYQLYAKLDMERKTIDLVNDLASLYQKENQNEQAITFANHGLMLAQKYNQKEDVKESYHILAKVHKTTKEFDLAYEYQEKYANIKDSIAKEQSLAELAKLEANHKAQEQQRVAKKKQEQRNNLQYLGISAFFILLFGGLFFVGDVAIPPHMMRKMIFIALFLTFQFLLLLLNPILQEYAGGVALFRLLINGCFALGFVFLIRYLETRINMRLEKRIRRRIKKRVQKKLSKQEIDAAKKEKSEMKKSSKKGMQSNMATS